MALMLFLMTVFSVSAKEYVFDWNEKDTSTHGILTEEGYLSDDGVVRVRVEQGTASKMPVLWYSNVRGTEGFCISVKIMKPGYRITKMGGAVGLKGYISDDGTFEADNAACFDSSNTKRRFKPNDPDKVLTEVKFSGSPNSNGEVFMNGELIVGYAPDNESATPDGFLMAFEYNKTEYKIQSSLKYNLLGEKDNTVIRYTVYEYTEGMAEPDVDETSPVYDPANPYIFRELGPTATGRDIRVAARAYTPGKQPSEVRRSGIFHIFPELMSSADMATYDKKKTNRPVYQGKATIIAVIPGYWASSTTKIFQPDECYNIYYLEDESGIFPVNLTGRGRNEGDAFHEWLGYKVGDVVTGFNAELIQPTNGATPYFNCNASGGNIELGPASKVEGATPFTEDYQACTLSTFKDMANNKPVLLQQVEYAPSYSSSNYYTFGGYGGVTGYYSTSSTSSTYKKGEEMKIPEGQTVDVYGVKTGDAAFHIIKWEKARRQAKTPFFFPYTDVHENTVTVASNQLMELTCSDKGTEIHYTLDGTTPDENSPLYTEPFMIPQDKKEVTIKAIAYGDEFKPSEVFTGIVTRDDYIAANISFYKPENLTPALTAPVNDGESVRIGNQVVFTAKAGKADIKFTITAPEGKTLSIGKANGKSYLEAPEGTVFTANSNYTLKYLQFHEADGLSITSQFDTNDTEGKYRYDFWRSKRVVLEQYGDDNENNVRTFCELTSRKAFKFNTIDIVVNDKFEYTETVASIPEAQVCDDNKRLKIDSYVRLTYIKGNEAYVVDNMNPENNGMLVVLEGAEDYILPTQLNCIKGLVGRMTTDEATGIRYFAAEPREYTKLAVYKGNPAATAIASLPQKTWKYVQLKDVKLRREEDKLTLIDKNNDYVIMDYHFGDLQIPENRWCDIKGVVRVDKNGINFAPESFEKLPVPAESISLDKTEVTITVNQSVDLIATVLPEDTSRKIVTWKSSDSEVASVLYGKVLGKKAGTATITATDTEGHTATCVVTVENIKAASIKISKETLTLTVGESDRLTAEILPVNAFDKTVVWTTSDETVATVDDGNVTAVKAGAATITATDTEGHTATCVVTVENIKAASITISDETLNLIVGETGELTAEILPEDAFDKTVVWTSSDESVATVDDGKVTAVKAGTANITATDSEGHTATCVVNVSNIMPESVTLSATTLEITETETAQLTATVLPEDAFDKTVIWTSSDETVANVDENGLVSALKEGTAVITAIANADSEVKAECTVTVTRYSGVAAIYADGNVSVKGNVLTINGCAGEIFTVYNTSGAQMLSISADGGPIVRKLDLQPGVYILRHRTGAIKFTAK